MAIVNEEALKKAIKSGNTNVFILFGEDGFLKKMQLESITKQVTESDDFFNFQRFENDCDLQEVYDAVLQFPVLNDKKCVILRDFDFAARGANDLEKLCLLINDVPETTVFILWVDTLSFEIKKNSKFDKIIKACDTAKGCAANLSHRSMPELEKMLSDGAIKRGCRLEGAAARYLIETAGDDIFTLKNELLKLCSFADGGVITKQTVEEVATRTVEADIYKLTDKILKCDLDAAYKILDDLFFMRVEPIVILSTVTNVYVDMHRVLSGKAHSFNNEKIAGDFGYGTRAFTLKDASYNLKSFDFNKLYLSFKALCDTDKALKSFSGNDRTVLEQLIVKLSYIAVKGEAVD